MKLVLGQHISYNTKIKNPQVLSFIKDKTIIFAAKFIYNLKSASNLNGNLNCSKELEHYAS